MGSILKFLDESVFENLLKKHINCDADVRAITTESFPVGDNFNSELLRVTISYSIPASKDGQSLSLIAKYRPDDIFMIKFSKEMKFFEREMLMYSTTLSKIYSFGSLKCISPKSYLIITEPKPTVLLEDLSVLDYRTVDSGLGLDLDHCFYVLERLAAFHASSVALHEKEPNSMDVYDQALYADVDGVKATIVAGLPELIDACHRRPELAKYGHKLDSLREGFLDRAFAAGKPSDNFNVLNHGDLWNNNIMFLHNIDGKIKDVRFVDYQAPYYSSPAIDLHYFTVVGMNFEARKKAMELLQYYHKMLTHNLMELGTKTLPPKWEEFFEDFRLRIFYGLTAVVITLALMKAGDRPDSCIVNYLNSEGEDGFRYYAFNNDRYLKELSDLMIFYEGLGFLEL